MRRLLIALLVLLLALPPLALVLVEQAAYAPRSLGPYIARRGSGHAPWIEEGSAWFGRLLVRLDRGELPEPGTALPDYPAWTGASPARSVPAASALRARTVGNMAELKAALGEAQAGDRITLLPGQYLNLYSIKLPAGGTTELPIVVRAERLGEVELRMESTEGFKIMGPHWRFENLHIRGVCRNHGDCEHAFHIVGKAHHVSLLNNRIEDFNAHIKVNAEEAGEPADGVIAGNTLVNTAPRQAHRPVTPIDIVRANRWRIEGNLIADFVKDGGDRVSYGAFAKGGSSGTVMARNVVLCEHRLRGHRGQRVGLSFGGGGTGKEFCADRQCLVEHEQGVMRDNLIAQCSDVGIYLNRAAATQIRDNTVFDTGGIDVRFATSSAKLSGNLVEGALRQRDGGLLHDEGNHASALWKSFAGWHPVRAFFADAAALDLAWRSSPPERSDTQEAPSVSLCGESGARRHYGAFDDFSACLRR